MSKFKPFRCVSCGDEVKLVVKAGRTEEYRRGVTLPVPDDFEIPTCPTCGEEYFTVALSQELAKRQAPLYAAWQRQHCKQVVDRIRKQHSVTLRQIESVCGVTGTYLSHVLSGRKASEPLIRLLEAYSLEPREFERQLRRVPWSEALVRAAAQPGQQTIGAPMTAPVSFLSTSSAPAPQRSSRAALVATARPPARRQYAHDEKPIVVASNDNVAA